MTRLPALFLAALSVLASAQEPPERGQGRPNIVLILADDWSFPHASIYGDPAIQTPNFDRVAAAGMLFTNAFAVAPTCTASRSALLTGQAPHRLDEAANLYGAFPTRFAVYPDMLAAEGYFVGSAGKGWSPGDWRTPGWTHNPAGAELGRPYDGLGAFLRRRKGGAPFCYWMGGHEPHRPYVFGKAEPRPTVPPGLRVPVFLPDTPEVRQDLADYYAEVARFDKGVGRVLDDLDAAGLTDNTLVVVTSDNGMPFPRAKANLYDGGTRVPMAIAWRGHIKPGSRSEAFVDLSDLAPTFLEAAGVRVPADVTGRSLLPILKGGDEPGRDHVFLERERHADCRPEGGSYPMRAVRSAAFLYIRNLRPERWPAGDPPSHCDIDGSASKREIAHHSELARLALDKRPAEELYDLRQDPDQLKDVAKLPGYQEARASLRALLDRWMVETKDPRAAGDDDRWDHYPYQGQTPAPPKPPGARAPKRP